MIWETVSGSSAFTDRVVLRQMSTCFPSKKEVKMADASVKCWELCEYKMLPKSGLLLLSLGKRGAGLCITVPFLSLHLLQHLMG